MLKRLATILVAATLTVLSGATPATAYQGSNYEQLIEDETLTDQHAIVIRFYAAVFGRTPDNDGVRFWLDQYDTGDWSTRRIANFFATSDEFTALYGEGTTNTEFVDAVYPNVLGRTPDAEGRTFWIGYLDAGNSRAEMILLVSNAPEFINANRLPFELDAPDPKPPVEEPTEPTDEPDEPDLPVPHPEEDCGGVNSAPCPRDPVPPMPDPSPVPPLQVTETQCPGDLGAAHTGDGVVTMSLPAGFEDCHHVFESWGAPWCADGDPHPDYRDFSTLRTYVNGQQVVSLPGVRQGEWPLNAEPGDELRLSMYRTCWIDQGVIDDNPNEGLTESFTVEIFTWGPTEVPALAPQAIFETHDCGDLLMSRRTETTVRFTPSSDEGCRTPSFHPRNIPPWCHNEDMTRLTGFRPETAYRILVNGVEVDAVPHTLGLGAYASFDGSGAYGGDHNVRRVPATSGDKVAFEFEYPCYNPSFGTDAEFFANVEGRVDTYVWTAVVPEVDIRTIECESTFALTTDDAGRVLMNVSGDSACLDPVTGFDAPGDCNASPDRTLTPGMILQGFDSQGSGIHFTQFKGAVEGEQPPPFEVISGGGFVDRFDLELVVTSGCYNRGGGGASYETRYVWQRG